LADRNRVLVLNGPNLNMLGVREPAVYGSATLADIEASSAEAAKRLGLTLRFEQSNNEGALVDLIQAARTEQDALIINAGAFTHTSIAILDALQLLEIPIIELHLSNIFAREEFRHHSYISPCATGVICGFGADGYVLALEAAKKLIAR
jgi:3-dehydroquinate dehydratase-2